MQTLGVSKAVARKCLKDESQAWLPKINYESAKQLVEDKKTKRLRITGTRVEGDASTRPSGWDGLGKESNNERIRPVAQRRCEVEDEGREESKDYRGIDFGGAPTTTTRAGVLGKV